MKPVSTLLVDADSWAYQIAYFHSLSPIETMEAIDDEIEVEDLEEQEVDWAHKAVSELLAHWMKLTKTTEYELHLSIGSKLRDVYEEKHGRPPKPGFRYAIADDLSHGYKHNRPASSVEGAEHVLEVMARHFNSVMHDEWEADDAVVAIKREYPDLVQLAAIDKDVLNQVAGVHFNYRRLEPHVTSEHDAIKHAYWQCLVGDPSDGYKGVPGVGKAKADKLLFGTQTEEQMWRAVLHQYRLKSMGETEAIATMRLANMNQLSVTGWPDNTQFELTLWQPPKLES